MLADDILAAVGGPVDRAWNGYIERIAKAIQRAERFAVTREVINSAQIIVQQPLEAQLRALQVCRLPFQTCWFEWPSGNGHREGALITVESDNPLSGSCFGASWLADERAALVLPVTGRFDWREKPAPIPDTLAQLNESEWSSAAALDPWLRGEDREAHNEFVSRHGMSFEANLPAYMRQKGPDGTDSRFELLKCMFNVRAVILLLNSRNISHTEPQVASEKLQRARRKSGKAPLLDHTRIDIRLSRAMAARAGAAADPGSPTRLHLVRGHFKFRRTGVFWWSAYARGHIGQGVVRHQIRHVKH